MSVKQLNDDLKMKSFSSLYYIYGEEEYLKNYYFEQLKKNVVVDLPEFNVTEFDAKSFDFLDFCNAVNSYPVMSDKKIVCVVDFDNSLLKKEFTKDFVSFMNMIPDFCVVVFCDTQLKTISGTNPLLKALSSCGAVCVEAKKPDNSSLTKWVMRHFKNNQKDISVEDIHYLIDIADSDMMSLEREISKLCDYVSSDTVKKEDIDAVVSKSIETNRYEIAEAFCNKDYTKLLTIVDKLYKQCVDDIVIANIFYRAFCDMWKAKIALNYRKSSQDLVSDFRINPYAAKQIIKNSKYLTKNVLEQAILLSLKLDSNLKSTPFNKKELIIVYLGEIINCRNDEK